ncbi:MAG: AAA family ATPase [Atopobiaceae bacterium]|nr:AAA family ATPase [Atopobiaceae bacterium]
MANYLNPGNAGFQEIRNALYVDKSGLIELVNRTIRTPQKLSCVSRPRRFGKSFAAKMLCAYYDRSCDSHALFNDLAIAQSPTYKAHLNKYDVLYVDMTAIIGEVGIEDLVAHIKERITEEWPIGARPLSATSGPRHQASIGANGRKGPSPNRPLSQSKELKWQCDSQ